MRICRYLTRADKSRQVDEFKIWALKKLLQRPEWCIPQRKDFYSGKIIPVRNKSFVMDLKFTTTKVSTARINDGIITLSVSSLLTEEQMEKAITHLISQCVARAMYPWVHERLLYWNTQHFPQVKFRTLRLKYAQSLWGSCSHHGNISISTRLLLAPERVIDYVLVHELAHLLVPNHSEKFWKVVEKAMPDYEESERWLKENGKHCEF